ncbi:789_t:CDS:2, partial [Dentiscutata heterogama]
LHVKDCSFYASLYTKPALFKNNTTKDNENGDSNTIKNNEIDMDKEFRKDKILYQLCIIKIDYVSEQEVDFDAFDKFAEQYKAAKSRSIGCVTTFLYDHRYNLDPLIKRMINKKFPNENRLFSDKDILKFRIQLIDWNNKAYSFNFEENWNDYLVKDPVYFWNNFTNEVPELAIFAAWLMSILPTSANSE